MLGGGFLMSRLFHLVKRVLLVPATLVIAFVSALGGGAAYAYFASGGSGSGSANTATMTAVAVSAVTGTPTTPLVPGGTGDVILKVTNPNTFGVSLTGVVFKTGGTITFDAGHSGCATADGSPVVVLNVPPADLPQAIPASSSVSFDLAKAVTMAAAATSNCQGATIDIPITITVQSS